MSELKQNIPKPPPPPPIRKVVDGAPVKPKAKWVTDNYGGDVGIYMVLSIAILFGFFVFLITKSTCG